MPPASSSCSRLQSLAGPDSSARYLSTDPSIKSGYSVALVVGASNTIVTAKASTCNASADALASVLRHLRSGEIRQHRHPPFCDRPSRHDLPGHVRHGVRRHDQARDRRHRRARSIAIVGGQEPAALTGPNTSSEHSRVPVPQHSLGRSRCQMCERGSRSVRRIRRDVSSLTRHFFQRSAQTLFCTKPAHDSPIRAGSGWCHRRCVDQNWPPMLPEASTMAAGRAASPRRLACRPRRRCRRVLPQRWGAVPPRQRRRRHSRRSRASTAIGDDHDTDERSRSRHFHPVHRPSAGARRRLPTTARQARRAPPAASRRTRSSPRVRPASDKDRARFVRARIPEAVLVRAVPARCR